MNEVPGNVPTVKYGAMRSGLYAMVLTVRELSVPTAATSTNATKNYPCGPTISSWETGQSTLFQNIQQGNIRKPPCAFLFTIMPWNGLEDSSFKHVCHGLVGHCTFTVAFISDGVGLDPTSMGQAGLTDVEYVRDSTIECEEETFRGVAHFAISQL